jgi:nicotinamide mononucleotide transporter
MIAFVLGIINVTLVVRRSVWNFPIGMAMVSLYAVVFWRERLYSDTLLQGFFFAVNGWGWRMWSATLARAGHVPVETMPARDRVTWMLGWVLISLAWGLAMERLTDASYPWLDAGIAAASIAAQLMMARRLLENWIIWIGVDIASVGLYAAKGLWLTMVLYVIFLGLSVWGLIDWRAAARAAQTRRARMAE